MDSDDFMNGCSATLRTGKYVSRRGDALQRVHFVGFFMSVRIGKIQPSSGIYTD